MAQEYSCRDLFDPTAVARTDVLTPKDALVSGLSACPPALRPVVLYSCGALCPVHRQHVRLQEMAKVSSGEKGQWEPKP